MANIYTIDYLKYLRDSPMVSRPAGLPPIEQWMGLGADSIHTINRRPVTDKNLPRNHTHSEDIILGPPKTSFISASSIRIPNKILNSTEQSGIQGATLDTRLKIRAAENDRCRESRSNMPRSRRTVGDPENDSWNHVQQRRNYGGEDSEKQINRPKGDRSKDEKNSKVWEDSDGKERSWGSCAYPRENDTDHDQLPERNHRNNGIGRGRHEPSWFRDKENNEVSFSSKDRYSAGEKQIDRNKGWRGKDKNSRADLRGERNMEKIIEKQDPGERSFEKKKDQRHENEPEWMEDPTEQVQQAHTLADFEKWKEQMQGKDKVARNQIIDKNIDPNSIVSGSRIETPLEFDSGPDKFLGLITSKDENFSEAMTEPLSEGVVKPKASGKASRFTSFFNSQDDPQKANPESQLKAAHHHSPDALQSPHKNYAQSDAEREAFQQLLQKLQRQTLQASNTISPLKSSPQPKSLGSEKAFSNSAPPQEVYQSYLNNRHDDGRSNTRLSQPAFQDPFTHSQIASDQHTIRPEQMLQELVTQRQNSLSQNPNSTDQQPSRNFNTEFLMGLMQSGKSVSDTQRLEAINHGIPSKSENRQLPHHTIIDHEQEIRQEALVQRERNASEHHTRSHPPPGFFEESAFSRGLAPRHDRQSGKSQPTSIIQRPPPLGLDIIGWERQAQSLAPQHRHIQNIATPPGLTNNLNRVIPIPQQQIFPPGFSVGNFLPPDVMAASSGNIQMQPPPGFYNAPSHGFMPPAMGGFQGPEGMAFNGTPFDGRMHPPPQGSFRR